MNYKRKFDSIFKYSLGKRTEAKKVIKALDLTIKDEDFENWMNNNVREVNVECEDFVCFLIDYEKNTSFSEDTKQNEWKKKNSDTYSVVNPDIPIPKYEYSKSVNSETQSNYEKVAIKQFDETKSMFETILKQIKNRTIIINNIEYDQDRLIQLLTNPNEYINHLERRRPEDYKNLMDSLKKRQTFKLPNGNKMRSDEAQILLHDPSKYAEFLKKDQPKAYDELVEHLQFVKPLVSEVISQPKTQQSSSFSIYDYLGLP